MKTRILVVDDNADLTSIVSLILTTEGFSVDVCHSLGDCANKIKEWNPHLLLLDVNVNGEDGRELCARLKSGEEQKKLKVLLMSGDEKALEHAYEADGCIAKPFDTALLVKTINRCVQQVKHNT